MRLTRPNVKPPPPRAGGKRVWIAQYRMGQKQRRVTIGPVETIDPGEARKSPRRSSPKLISALTHRLQRLRREPARTSP